MQRNLLTVILLGVVVILFSGCRTAPVMNITDAGINPVSGKEVTLEQVTQAIVGAATATRPAWSMNVVEPGHILASLNIRSHSATVDIVYTTKSYSINYNESRNLKYDADNNTIHSNYNSWIQNLDSAIKGRLAVL